MEESIKNHRIKELKENRIKLEAKIKSLEENIKLIENNDLSKLDLNNSINANLSFKEIVDENIKRSKIKDIKNAKYLLEDKLNYLDTQIKELLNIDENTTKKFDVKSYLENFEKDLKEAELREQKWKRDQIQRIKKFEDEQQRIQEKLKEKAEQEEIFYLQKKQEVYQKQLEKIKNKSNNIKDDMNKLNEKKDEWKSNPIDEKQYLFKIVDVNYKKKEIEEREEFKNKMVSELAKKKILFKPLEKGELEEYQKKFEEEKKKKNYEKEKERLLKKEELMKRNLELPKSDTKIYEKIVEEEKKLRENREKEKLDRVYNAMKIKQFSKVVLKNMVPKLDEDKKQELQELIKKSINIRPEKLTKSKHERIILKRPDPEKPKKYNWELKLEDLDEKDKNKNIIKYQARSLSKINIDKDNLEENNEKNSVSRIKSSGKKVSALMKNPDYLTIQRNEKLSRSNDKGLETEFQGIESKDYFKLIINNYKQKFYFSMLIAFEKYFESF